MEPGLSEVCTWNAGGAPWGMVGTAEMVTGGVDEGSGVASVVTGTLDGAGGVASEGATMVEGRSELVADVTEGSGGVEAAVDEESTAGSGAED